MTKSQSTRALVWLGSIAVGLVFVSWLVLGLSERADNIVVDRGVVPAPAPPSDVNPNPLVEPVRDPNSITRVQPESKGRAAEGPDAAELAEGTWVEGRVTYPAKTPADERVFVVAAGREFASGKLHRVAVASDGTFKVAFAPRTKRAALRLEARYLYLEEPRALKLDPIETDIVLVPALGGRILGRVQPSSAARAAVADISNALVSASGWRPGSNPPRTITAKVGDEFAFELGGLDPVIGWSLTCKLRGLAQAEARDVRVTAGGTTSIELALEQGATVRGIVQDESGQAVAKADLISTGALDLQILGSRVGARSDAEGRFELTSLSSGTVQVGVFATGFVAQALAPLDLADGEVREGLTIVLSRGLSISGLVRFPDGRPAPDIKVTVDPATVDPPPYGLTTPLDLTSVKTAYDGSFVVSGLKAGAHLLTARSKLMESEAPEASAAAGRRLPRVRLQAQRSDVQAGTTGVVLTLASGNAVRGRVIDDRGVPLTGFVVRSSSELTGDHRSQSFASEDGSFEIAGLADGEWTISAEAKGKNSSGGVRLRLPDDTAPLELVVPRMAGLSALVLDPDAQPIAGASLRWVRRESDQGHFSSHAARQKSDDRGFITIEESPGEVAVCAVHASWAPSASVDLELVPGSEGTPITLQLRRGGTILGIVRDPEGAPASDREVTLHTNTPDGGSRRSDKQGEFRFDHVIPGEVRLTLQPRAEALAATRDDKAQVDWSAAMDFNSRATVRVVEGETAHVELGGGLTNAVRVAGVVRSRGPVPDAKVRFHGPRGDSGAKASAYATRSNDKGAYEISLSGEGNYSVNIQSGENWPITTHVRVPNAPSFELDLVLPTGTIAGRVLSDKGDPVGGIHVSASVPGAQVSADGPIRIGKMEVQTGADGVFSFAWLSAGRYVVEATPGTYSTLEGAAKKFANARVEDIVLSEGGVVDGLELRLPRAAILRGTVRNLAGAPVAGASVMAREAAGGKQYNWWQNQPTDAAGRFAIEGVSAGSVSVIARSGALVSEESSPITVRAGETSELELILRSGNALVVRCVDAADEPVTCQVELHDESGRDYSGFTAFVVEQPSRDDRYARRVNPLPDGNYKVRITGSNGKSTTERVTLRGGIEREVRVRTPE